MRKILSVILSLSLFMIIMSPTVMADETALAQAETVETTETNDSVPEVPDEPEIIHIADGEELPDYFYVVPKEDIKKKSDDSSFEALYAYIAIEIKERYLDPNNISAEGYQVDYDDYDLMFMESYYAVSIEADQFSYYLEKTFPVYTKENFVKGDEIVSCIMRAIFCYFEAIGEGGETAFASKMLSIGDIIELTPDKLTFSEEQLHYFDN